jgi:DNA-binding NtrC family response regulator
MTHTVLLVDDDADVLHSLARMLQKQPYQLYTARSGEEAVIMFKSRKVDVLVADERMPGMSGLDLLAWVAGNYPDVVRIMLTGHAGTDTAIRAINEAGVFYFFTKPCNEAYLAIMIRKALEHKDLLGEHAQLLEISRQQAKDRERFVEEVSALGRLLSRDVRTPLGSVAQSCQALLEQHRDVFDPEAKSLIEGTLDAISDMQCLIEDLQARMRVWESKGGPVQSRAAPEPILSGT